MDNYNYHVIGICREHGPQVLTIKETKEEARNFAHNEAFEGFGSGLPNGVVPIITDVHRTPNTVDFVANIDGTIHDMLITFQICSLPMPVCTLRHYMDTMRDAAAIMERGGPNADRVKDVLERSRNGIEFEEEPTIDPSVFNSIDKFLSEHKENDGPIN